MAESIAERAKRIEIARWMMGGLAAASFGGLFTAIGNNLTTVGAHRAATWLVIGGVPQIFYLLLTTQPEGYRPGWFSRLLVVLSVFFTVIGLTLLIGSYDTGAGIAFAGMSLLCALGWMKAEGNAKLKNANDVKPAVMQQT